MAASPPLTAGPVGPPEATARRLRRPRLSWAAAWLPVLAGATIRLGGLDRLSFWLDEAFSVDASRRPPAAILDYALHSDVHPPLYYLILHYWILAGTAEWWVRLLSALLGILTIPALYLLGRVLVGPRAGLAGAWLLALSPWHVWYSQEARMYVLVCLLGTLAWLCGARFLRDGRLLAAPGYVLAVLAGLYSEYTMALVWLPAAVLLPWLAGRRPAARRRLLLWLLLQGVIVAGLLPLLPFLQAHLGVLVSSEYLRPRIGRFADDATLIVLAVGGGTLLLAGARAWLRRRRPRVVVQIESALLLLALLGVIAGMLVPGGLTAKRVLVELVPLACLGGAWALTQLRLPGLTLRALLAASALALLALAFALPKEDWRAAVATIHAAAAPGDWVLIEANWMTIPFDYYDRGQSARAGLSPPQLNPQLVAQLHGYRRVWLILSEEQAVDPDGAAARWFATHYPLLRTLDYYHIHIGLYQLR